MRTAKVLIHDQMAGLLTETDQKNYVFRYEASYQGPPVSLTIPVQQEAFTFDHFPSFFEGLLPEGVQLEALLKLRKIDRSDYFAQLMATGADLVGAVNLYPSDE